MTLDDDELLENVRLAAGCGAKPTTLLIVALASLSAPGVPEAVDELVRLRDRIARLDRDTARPHPGLAELEPELLVGPPIARMRLDIRDHELRGHLVFRDLARNKSFVQASALAIGGVELADSDASLLDEIGVIAQLADPRIWPLTVSRRIALKGGETSDALLAGLATLATPQMTGMPAAGFMRFLDRVEARVYEGSSVASVVRDTLASGERIPGVGRPVLLGIDERVPPMLDAIRRRGRDRGLSMMLTEELSLALAQKGLNVNSAGVFGAIARDLGFSPDAAAAFAMIYFLVPLLAHSCARSPPSHRETSGSHATPNIARFPR